MKVSHQIMLVLGVLVGLTAAGIPLTRATVGAAALPALWWAAGGCAAAALCSLLPLLAVQQLRMYDLLPQAALGAMTLRMMLTGGFLLAVTRLVDLPYRPFVVWLMTFYLGLLVAETVIAWSHRRYCDGPPDRSAAT